LPYGQSANFRTPYGQSVEFCVISFLGIPLSEPPKGPSYSPYTHRHIPHPSLVVR
jgi:hypothetical protein